MNAPLEHLPIFVRHGSIVLLGPVVQHTGERGFDPLTVEIFGLGDAASFVVHRQDEPEIGIDYVGVDSDAQIRVHGAPGEIEIVLHGVDETSRSRTVSADTIVLDFVLE